MGDAETLIVAVSPYLCKYWRVLGASRDSSATLFSACGPCLVLAQLRLGLLGL